MDRSKQSQQPAKPAAGSTAQVARHKPVEATLWKEPTEKEPKVRYNTPFGIIHVRLTPPFPRTLLIQAAPGEPELKTGLGARGSAAATEQVKKLRDLLKKQGQSDEQIDAALRASA